MEQQSVSKHYCKVCNRGFGCAGALGGHMRSHSVGDNNVSSIIQIPEGGSNNTKHPYFLRNSSNRFASYRGIEDGENVVLEKKSSPNREEGHRHYQYASSEEEDLANYLVMLSSKKYVFSSEKKAKDVEKVGGFNGFQCKACKKVFSSHQALGGHRASHKKVKGCYAAKYIDDDNNDDENNTSHHDLNLDDDEYKLSPHSSPEETDVGDSRRKISKTHECFICHRVFSSGQALGGHKRCHWLTSNNLSDNTFIPNLQDFQYYDPEYQHIFKKPMFSKSSDGETKFDLNFPPTFINLNSASRIDNMRLNLNNNGDGEQQCKTTTKTSRLHELKDLNFDEGSSRWLQMGITSTSTSIPWEEKLK